MLRLYCVVPSSSTGSVRMATTVSDDGDQVAALSSMLSDISNGLMELESSTLPALALNTDSAARTFSASLEALTAALAKSSSEYKSCSHRLCARVGKVFDMQSGEADAVEKACLGSARSCAAFLLTAFHHDSILQTDVILPEAETAAGLAARGALLGRSCTIVPSIAAADVGSALAHMTHVQAGPYAANCSLTLPPCSPGNSVTGTLTLVDESGDAVAAPASALSVTVTTPGVTATEVAPGAAAGEFRVVFAVSPGGDGDCYTAAVTLYGEPLLSAVGEVCMPCACTLVCLGLQHTMRMCGVCRVPLAPLFCVLPLCSC